MRFKRVIFYLISLSLIYISKYRSFFSFLINLKYFNFTSLCLINCSTVKVSHLTFVIFVDNGERTKDKMYEYLDGAAACFRRLNGTHQTGCTCTYIFLCIFRGRLFLKFSVNFSQTTRFYGCNSCDISSRRLRFCL